MRLFTRFRQPAADEMSLDEALGTIKDFVGGQVRSLRTIEAGLRGLAVELGNETTDPAERVRHAQEFVATILLPTIENRVTALTESGLTEER